jgi:DNA-binding CsgD family transcriptional regulator/tetratricopeptide (TPR) repeat protein
MTRLGPLLCPILVGRDDLLELADRRLEEVAAGRGQFILLAGEAGIGKSRLVGAVERKARARGFRFAAGYVAPQDREVAAASLLDLARTMLRIPDFADLGHELLGLRAAAAASNYVRRRMFVLNVVDRLAAAIERPTMLGFEDLQWTDDLSLEIIGELGRRGREAPLLVVGSYRTDELPPGASLRDWRARLLTQRLAEEARLAPLTLDQTALMTTLIINTGLPAPREVVSAVYERTDGIPLHVEELLGALGEGARTDGRAIRDAVVPETIEDAVLERLRGRSADARAVAQAGAVIGRCFVPEVLAGIMDVHPEALDDPLQELVDHDFLEPPGARGLYDFRHQLLRDVLYRSVPERDRRRLHARAAEFGARLEGASEVHASVHFERAGLRPQAFRAAVSGAREAARMSLHREAVELYRRAVDNLPEDIGDAEHADLLYAFSEEAAAVEDDALALDLATSARDRYIAAARPIDAARMCISIASIARRTGRPIAERIDPLQIGLAELDSLPATPERERLRSLFLVILSVVQLDGLQTEEARQNAMAARALAEEAGDTETALDATSRLGSVKVVAGEVDAGLNDIARAALEARKAGYEDVSVTAYRDAALMASRVMDYRSATTWLDDGLRYAYAVEQSHCGHIMGATRALVAWAAGRWDEAIAIGEQSMADRGGGARAAVTSRAAIGYVASGRGRFDRARAVLEEAFQIGLQSEAPDLILPPLWGLAETDLLAGQEEAAAERCERARELAVASGERALLTPFVVTGARAWLGANRPDAAERWLARVAEHLGPTPRFAHPALDHATGLVRLAAGSTGAARDALETAVRGWGERGRIWEATWARLDLARCLVRTNRHADAASLLGDVRTTAAGLDSGPLVSVTDELTRLARGRGFEEEPWRPLTAREYEVARLIATGLTNAEIAGELSIAPKTASAHVEHILAKLGVMRRTEIAAWVSTVAPATNGSRTPEAAVSGRR